MDSCSFQFNYEALVSDQPPVRSAWLNDSHTLNDIHWTPQETLWNPQLMILLNIAVEKAVKARERVAK